MDTKSKNIDCYFYYYSECVRGNFCKFRHEPSALGCEEMCAKWKEGNCTEPHCSLRHMDVLKKKRKEIPCYWEMQPGGCRKAHCAFKHQVKGTQAPGDSPTVSDSMKKETDSSTNVDDSLSLEGGIEASSAEVSRRLSQNGPESFNTSSTAVEPIVVNFEEESDSESAPSWTPSKVQKEKDSLHVKTLEEIRLEKIQAESAAYWEGIAGGPMAWEAANPAANPSASPCGIISGPRKPNISSAVNYKKSNPLAKNVTKELDFRVLSLDEIRRNRAKKLDSINGLARESQNCNLSNGCNSDPSKDAKSTLGFTDLRMKLSKGKVDGQEISNSSDSWSSKRQLQDSTLPSGPVKKQRIRLRRLSDLTAQNATETNNFEDRLCGESDIDGHIISDIDKLLMEEM